MTYDIRKLFTRCSGMPKRLFSYAIQESYPLGMAFIQLIAIAIVEIAKPWPFKFVVDYVIGGEILPFRLEYGRYQILAISCFLVITIYALSAVLQFFSVSTRQQISKRMVTSLRSQLYSHLQRLSLAFHHGSSHGDLIYRVTSDTVALQQYYNNGVLPLLSASLAVLGMFVVMLTLDAPLAMASVVLLPILLLLLKPFLSILKKKSSILREAESSVLQAAQRGLENIQIVQAFSQEKLEYDRFMISSDKGLSSSVDFYNTQAVYSAIVNIIVGIWVAVLIAVGASQVISGRITTGTLVVFISYLAVMLISVNQATEYIANIRAALAGTDRIFRILDEPTVIDSGVIVATPSLFDQSIQFSRVNFSYSDSHAALKGINITIPSRSKVAIVGPTGAGKSTLVSLLPRFYEPQLGEIFIGNTNIQNLTLSSLRENIALVLQPPLLFPATILDNITYGNSMASLDEVVAACQAAKIHTYIESLPNGYYTHIGERAEQLSQGQKQRLTIARALVKKAPLLILDEPTSAMDPQTEYEVMSSLDALYKDKTAIIIAHRLSTVKTSDLILVMNDGNIVEQGSYQYLVASDGLFARLHRHSLGLEVDV